MRILMIGLMFAAILAVGCASETLTAVDSNGIVTTIQNDDVAGKFDDLGYNRTARIFNGPADGVDGTLDGAVWGDATYASDHLKMKWNSEWDRGNAEGWANGPYAAWIDNTWNGKFPGGSGDEWLYRIKWIGLCGADGTPTGDGGYCIWGQFEVIFDGGTILNQHFWFAHATPAGFGN